MPMKQTRSGGGNGGGAQAVENMSLTGHTQQEAEAFVQQEQLEQQAPPPEGDEFAPPDGQGAPHWWKERMGEVSAKKNEAMAALTAAQQENAAMKARLETLERFVPGAQQAEAQEEEWKPQIPSLPPRPETMDEDTYNFLSGAIHDYAAALFNQNVPTYLEHRMKPVQQSISQFSGSLQSVQDREAAQALDRMFGGLEARYPALKDADVKADLKAMLAGRFGGRQMDDALLKEVTEASARFASRFGRAPAPVPQGVGAPRQAMPGARNGAPGPTRGNPLEWRPLSAKTFSDYMK